MRTERAYCPGEAGRKNYIFVRSMLAKIVQIGGIISDFC